MLASPLLASALIAVATQLILAPSASAQSPHWPQFRGPGARGIAEGHATATTWNIDEEENVRWQVDLPGLAHSSPVIWGDRIFVTCAEKDGDAELRVGLYGSGDPVEDEGEHVLSLFCLDKESGEVLWEEPAYEGVPEIKRHPKATHANSSPAVDAEHVVAFFGSDGLFCFDHEGTLIWKKDFGLLDCGAPGMRKYQWGFASSPVIHEGKVIVQCDVHDQSFLSALRIQDGEEIWRADRDEDPTWGTPTVDVRDGRAQVLCNGYKHMGGYDLHSGRALWWMSGGGDVPVPALVVAEDLIYVTNAHGRNSPMCAVDVLAEGELQLSADEPQMRWFHARRGNYMQTPLVYRGQAYFCSDSGILTCLDAKTGEQHYRERIGDGNSGYSASAVAANGKVYISSEEGLVHVLEAGVECQPLARNELNEICMATPAISEGVLYFRTRGHLVAIAED